MKLHTVLTPSHQIMYEKYFKPSLKDGFELCIYERPQVGPCEQHVYGSREFNALARKKVQFLIQAIRDNWESVFLFSDVDIVFFRSVVRDLTQRIRHYDFIVQRNSILGDINSGFWVLRANERTLSLWKKVEQMMKADLDLNDQPAINQLLLGRKYGDLESRLCRWACQDLTTLKAGGPFHHVRRARAQVARLIFQMKRVVVPRIRTNEFGLRWAYLPDSYYCPGLHLPKVWENDISALKVPKHLFLYHANWTRGVENKMAHLEHVTKLD